MVVFPLVLGLLSAAVLAHGEDAWAFFKRAQAGYRDLGPALRAKNSALAEELTDSSRR
jgi:hypothetical protein